MIRIAFKIIVLLLFVVSTNSAAQITSNGFHTEQTEYSGSSEQDPVFFYTDITSAVLNAPTGGVDYNWYSYSTTTGNFDEPVQLGVSSTLTNIEEKGYMVRIDDGIGNINNYYCWNFTPVLQVDSIVAAGTCKDLSLTADGPKDLTYYDHKGDKSALMVNYCNWSSSTGEPADTLTGPVLVLPAPYKDTEYTVEAGARFNSNIPMDTASLSYTSIAVKAEIDYNDETAENEANIGSAQRYITFKDKSSTVTDDSFGNVTRRYWYSDGVEIEDFSTQSIAFHEVGEHTVMLTVVNEDSGCRDSATAIINIDDMVIKYPNAFTPFSSPGQNDEFRVSYRSVKTFTMVIYNRWGRKVYQSNNPAEGWNGRINSRKAEPGVYFFRIEAEGFQGEKKDYEGAVHLIVN